MKKLSPNSGQTVSHSGAQKCGTHVARAAVHQILKAAYRRHARGRIAQEAMTACLGR